MNAGQVSVAEEYREAAPAQGLAVERVPWVSERCDATKYALGVVGGKSGPDFMRTFMTLQRQARGRARTARWAYAALDANKSSRSCRDDGGLWRGCSRTRSQSLLSGPIIWFRSQRGGKVGKGCQRQKPAGTPSAGLSKRRGISA